MSKKILVIGMNYIGDTLFVTPLIKALKEYYKDSFIDIVNGSRGVDILANNKDIRNIITKPNNESEYKDFIKKIKSEKYDIGYTATTSFYGAVYLYKANIPIRVGVNSEARGILLTHKTSWLKHKRHIIDTILSPLKTLGIDVKSKKLNLYLSDSEIMIGKKMTEKYERILFVHAGATRISKRYPTKLFADAIKTFYEATGSDIILIGGKEDTILSNEIKSHLGNNYVIKEDFTGMLSIRELIGVLNCGFAFLGGDSAPLHISSALGLKTLGLYGDTMPLIYGAMGANAVNIDGGAMNCHPLKRYYCEHFKRGCKTIECLSEIDPSIVSANLINFY